LGVFGLILLSQFLSHLLNERNNLRLQSNDVLVNHFEVFCKSLQHKLVKLIGEDFDKVSLKVKKLVGNDNAIKDEIRKEIKSSVEFLKKINCF